MLSKAVPADGPGDEKGVDEALEKEKSGPWALIVGSIRMSSCGEVERSKSVVWIPEKGQPCCLTWCIALEKPGESIHPPC
jgi:hypothetical protein